MRVGLMTVFQQYKHAIVIICLLASSFAGYWIADTKWQAKYDAHLLSDAQANEKATAETLTKQQSLLRELENAYKIAKTMQDTYESDRIAAADSASRMREQIAKYKAAASRNDPSPISIGANSATDRLVLANVLARADEAAGTLADYADTNRKALINCNNEYSALRVANAQLPNSAN